MPLSKEKIEYFRKRLLDARNHLSITLRGVSEDVRNPEENKGYSQHQADEGTDDFDRRISLNVSHTELNVLRQIDRALEKMDEETYGICEDTGKEIPEKRLEAVPWAIRTAEAQEKFEKSHIEF